jgi:predicted nucleic acid-binding protein
MIYVDTSVVLAQLLAEDRRPDPTLWQDDLISSRLLEYEVWTRLHARALTLSHDEPVRLLLGRIAFLELVRPVLRRACEAFPVPVRTLDALHLASIDYLLSNGHSVQLATFDVRMARAATALGVQLRPPE